LKGLLLIELQLTFLAVGGDFAAVSSTSTRKCLAAAEVISKQRQAELTERGFEAKYSVN
jgi:hypothetical protein